MKIFLVLSLYLISISSIAQWNPNPIINTPIAIAPKSQDNVHSVSDSKGGSIIAWDDSRNFLVSQ